MGLGQVLGAISLGALIALAFNIGVGPTLQLLFDYHDRLLSLVLGWAEPTIRAMLETISRWLSLELSLHPHWKQVFFLLSLYFGAYVYDAIFRRFWGAASFYFASGLTIAVIAAIGSGIVAISSQSIRSGSDILIVVFPLIAVIVFSLTTAFRAAAWFRPENRTFLEQLAQLTRHPIRFAAGGGVVVILAWTVDWLAFAPHIRPSYVCLLILAFGLAAYRLILRDAWQGQKNPPTNSFSEWWSSVQASGGGRIGWRMTKAFIGAVALVVGNVGLQQFGL